MRVKLYGKAGNITIVEESRLAEYKAAGYIPVADVIDVKSKIVDVEETKDNQIEAIEEEKVEKPAPKRGRKSTKQKEV